MTGQEFLFCTIMWGWILPAVGAEFFFVGNARRPKHPHFPPTKAAEVVLSQGG